MGGLHQVEVTDVDHLGADLGDRGAEYRCRRAVFGDRFRSLDQRHPGVGQAQGTVGVGRAQSHVGEVDVLLGGPVRVLVPPSLQRGVQTRTPGAQRVHRDGAGAAARPAGVPRRCARIRGIGVQQAQLGDRHPLGDQPAGQIGGDHGPEGIPGHHDRAPRRGRLTHRGQARGADRGPQPAGRPLSAQIGQAQRDHLAGARQRCGQGRVDPDVPAVTGNHQPQRTLPIGAQPDHGLA